jgi:hypothetical protein
MKLFRKFLNWEYSPLLILVAINLLIGIFTFQQYGESWDERSLLDYAEQSLNAYRGLFQGGSGPVYDDALRFYGPAYVMVQLLVAKILPLNWLDSDIGHLVNFITFQIGLVAFYLLCRRWFSVWASFCATLLFSTQPLFWGHAFINSKDIPFMMLFVVTILTGLSMVDRTASKEKGTDSNEAYRLERLIQDEWQTVSPSRKKSVLIFLVLGILFIIVGATTIIYLKPWTGITPAIALENPENIALEIYLRRLMNIVIWISTFVIISAFWFGCILRFGLPQTGKKIWKIEILPYLNSFRWQIANPRVLLAGLALGLVISTRALGIAAALLVLVYALQSYGKKSLPVFIPYVLVAVIVIYITWPYLWPMPIVRFLMSIKAILQFPWPGEVLFNARFYTPDALPSYAIPWLITIQLTEPVVLLSIIGFAFLIWNALKQKQQVDLFLLIGVWFVLPLAWTLLPFSSTYDNFRQLFFILPPVFMSVGKIFDWMREKFSQPLLLKLIPTILIIPGIYGISQLHPYEYIYYNEFIGGVNGAFRKYETDYWVTSFRAATDALNEFADPGSNIYVWGPLWIVKQYAREDLQIHPIENVDTVRNSNALTERGSYVILSSRYNYDLLAFPDAQVVYKEIIDDAVLSVVKYVPPE